jgi:hypothetical protein
MHRPALLISRSPSLSNASGPWLQQGAVLTWFAWVISTLLQILWTGIGCRVLWLLWMLGRLPPLLLLHQLY